MKTIPGWRYAPLGDRPLYCHVKSGVLYCPATQKAYRLNGSKLTQDDSLVIPVAGSFLSRKDAVMPIKGDRVVSFKGHTVPFNSYGWEGTSTEIILDSLAEAIGNVPLESKQLSLL